VRNSSAIGRVAALAAVAIAIVAIAYIVLSSGGTNYKVYAIFRDASQIISGDQVQVGGTPIGSIPKITLTPNGEAKLELDINNSDYVPLREGTIATVRNPSLTSVANRYVDLRLAPGNARPIPNGGTIPSSSTNSAVDLDELFNTLNPPTRKALQNVIQGSAIEYCGSLATTNCYGYGAKAQAAWKYLNPAVASASVLFSELNRDTARFTNFITKTGNLFSDISTRQADLSSLIRNLSSTTTALANQHVALGQAIQRLPGFMHLANTTFVNLRGALDDLQPLVDVSKPVAPKLQKLLVQLRPLAQDAVPTVKNLSQVVYQPGTNNDLTDLTRLGVPLANATVNNVNVHGKSRPGAFPESTQALNGSTPEIANFRPYSVDLTGWFEDYSHPGVLDANGGVNRAELSLGAYSFSPGGSTLSPVSNILQDLTNANNPFLQTGALQTGYGDRCPGSMERGGVFYPESGFPCNPKQVPTGN
jgi:phospholipid/cholesterol/gamma-HCH transport system substrate-binding protein